MDSSGNFLLPNNKAELVNKIISSIPEAPLTSTTPASVLIIDGMALVNTLKKTQATLTCADLLRQFIQSCMVLSRHHGQVRVLMDTYLPGSLKEQTRLKRSGPDPIRYLVKDDTCIKKVSLRTFLSHTGTKQELTGYLCEGLVNTVPGSDKMIVVDFGGKTLTNTPGLVEFSQTGHEEADTLIPLHVLDVCRHDPAPPRIDIYCKDTDVYTLLLHLVATQEITSEVWMLAGTADKPKDICLNHHVANLGRKKSEAVLGLHAFTGGDWGGKFSGVTKERWTQRFLELDEDSDVITALQNLGTDPQSNDDDLSFESFVCLVYDKSGKCTSTNKLRWESYRTKGSEGENLPPTRGAIVQHFRRAWLAAVIR